MISDRAIYRAASLLIHRHGADAMIEAAQLLDMTLERGDLHARDVWLRVKRAITALQAPSTRTMH